MVGLNLALFVGVWTAVAGYHSSVFPRNPIDWNAYKDLEAQDFGCPPGSHLKRLGSEAKGDICRFVGGGKKHHFVCPKGCAKIDGPAYCVANERRQEKKSPCRAKGSEPIRGSNFSSCLTIDRGFMPKFMSEADARRVLEVVDASFRRSERVQQLEAALNAPKDEAGRRRLRRDLASFWLRPESRAALSERAPEPPLSDAGQVALLLAGQIRSFLTPPVRLFWRLAVGAMREAGREPRVFGSLVPRSDREEREVRAAFEELGVLAELDFTRELKRSEDQHTRRAAAFRLMAARERETGTAASHVLSLRPDCLYLPLTRAESLAQLFEADDVVVVSSDLFASMPRRLAGLYPSFLAASGAHNRGFPTPTNNAALSPEEEAAGAAAAASRGLGMRGVVCGGPASRYLASMHAQVHTLGLALALHGVVYAGSAFDAVPAERSFLPYALLDGGFHPEAAPKPGNSERGCNNLLVRERRKAGRESRQGERDAAPRACLMSEHSLGCVESSGAFRGPGGARLHAEDLFCACSRQNFTQGERGFEWQRSFFAHGAKHRTGRLPHPPVEC